MRRKIRNEWKNKERMKTKNQEEGHSKYKRNDWMKKENWERDEKEKARQNG